MEDDEYERILTKINDLESEATFSSYYDAMTSIIDLLSKPTTLDSELSSVLTGMFRDAMKYTEHSQGLRSFLRDYGWVDGENGGQFSLPIADRISLRDRIHLHVIEATFARKRGMAEKLTAEEVDRFLVQWEDTDDQTEERKAEVLRRLNQGDVNALFNK